MHLLIEACGGVRELMADKGYVRQYMLDITKITGMTLIDGPHVHDSPNGIVGMAIWAESHISYHYVADSGVALIDLFSCKPFDTNEALQATISMFKFQQSKVQTIERGLEYLPNGGVTQN